jgi:hypothetical protein
LPPLIQGKDLSSTIEQRRRYRSIALNLEVPPVLFSDDLKQSAGLNLRQLERSSYGIALSAVAEEPHCSKRTDAARQDWKATCSSALRLIQPGSPCSSKPERS